MAGLAQYSPYFQNPLLTDLVREIPIKKGYISERFLPRDETYDLDFHETIIDRQADMADLMDSGAEIPLTDRDPIRTVSGSIADMGQSYIVTKKELAALMDRGNSGRRKVAEKQILGKVATCKGNIDARFEWMGWQALGEGAITYAKNGIKLGVDFGVTAKNVLVKKWNAADPTILTDYEAQVQAYVDRTGYIPDTFVTGIAVVRAVLNDATLRKAVTGYSDKLLTLDELNAFLRGRDMPPMEAFDATVTYRDPNADGARTTVRLLDAKKGVFLREGGEIGKNLVGPTVENQMNPGIFARTISQERPMREIVEVVAAGFPKVTNPDQIQIVTVFA